MAFDFRLRAVLRVKQRVEDQRAQVVAEAVRQATAAAHALEEAAARCLAARDAVTRASRAGSTGAELRALAQDAETARAEVHTLAERVAVADVAVATARRALLQAAQDRRGLERLQALHRAAWLSAAHGREQRGLDDVASIAYVRRTAAEANA